MISRSLSWVKILLQLDSQSNWSRTYQLKTACILNPRSYWVFWIGRDVTESDCPLAYHSLLRCETILSIWFQFYLTWPGAHIDDSLLFSTEVRIFATLLIQVPQCFNSLHWARRAFPSIEVAAPSVALLASRFRETLIASKFGEKLSELALTCSLGVGLTI